MPMPSKPCKWCGSLAHWQYRCRLNPNIKKTIKTRGKSALKWENTRRDWFTLNPSPYYCYLCGKYLTRDEVTLDHIVPRSHDAYLRYDMSNLAPCCWTCNTSKGSQSLENYKKGKDYA